MSEINARELGNNSIDNLEVETAAPNTTYHSLQIVSKANLYLHDGEAITEYLRIQQEKVDFLNKKFSDEIDKMESRLKVIFNQLEQMKKLLSEK